MKVMGQTSWRAGAPMQAIELPTPEPRRGELRVAVQAIGVNPVDWKLRDGPALMRLAARALSPPPPVVVGVDFAGVVDAVGPDVDVQVGDLVVGGTDLRRGQRGSYADTVVVRADQVCVLPPGTDVVAAGALPVAGATAWMAVVDIGRARAGDAVLVLGASGGVGHLAVQIAKGLGARVVGVCSTKNVARVRGYGADDVIDYTAGDPLTAARAGGPYRVVVDCVGAYAASRCRALLGPGGRHVVVAGDGGASAVATLVPPFSTKTLLGIPNRARLRPVVERLLSGALRVEIAAQMPLADAEQAHALGKRGAAGKLVLIP